MNLQENIQRIKEIMGLLNEDFNVIKNNLFDLLNKTEKVEKEDYFYSFFLMVGGPKLEIPNLKDNLFFDTTKNTKEIVANLWPWGEKHYWNDEKKWFISYIGLVKEYKLYDKESNAVLTINITRLDTESGDPDFHFFIFLDVSKENKENKEKIKIDDEEYNVYGLSQDSDDNMEIPNNSFSELSQKLKLTVKNIEDIKKIFYYLDGLI